MQISVATRSAGIFTPGWYLGRERPNEYGYRDAPIERGKPDEVATSLPNDIRERLRGMDMRSVEPDRLSELAAHLYWEGYISEDSFTQFAVFALDHRGPIDVLALMRDSLSYLRGTGESQWGLAIRTYEAAIDAAEGIRGLIDHLNGQLVDLQV